MTPAAVSPLTRAAPRPPRPPLWLIAATGVLAATCLVLAIAETNLWAHYLIDSGEFVSLFGLVFIAIAGVILYRQRRLAVSLPLVAPWLLYPVITQGDQIIDNLSINWMRAVCQVLLAAIFGTPVAVAVLAARYALAPKPGTRSRPRRWTSWFPGLRPLAEGRTREGMALLGAALLATEIWAADAFLGTLMIVTLIVMVIGVLGYGFSGGDRADGRIGRRVPTERFALIVLLAGVAVSAALFVGYKNRPGAYQGSPSYYLDPAQKNAGYPLDQIAVPHRAPQVPASPEVVRDALSAYGAALDELMAGYYILDRNYNYNFHNELFLRNTPLLPDYRRVGLSRVAAAERLRTIADARADLALATLATDDPLAALLGELRAYLAFNLGRAPQLERMSGEFEQTKAGLQHATHLYEGENKMLTERLGSIVTKHRAVLEDRTLTQVTADFAAKARRISEAYANRVVGF